MATWQPPASFPVFAELAPAPPRKTERFPSLQQQGPLQITQQYLDQVAPFTNSTLNLKMELMSHFCHVLPVGATCRKWHPHSSSHAMATYFLVSAPPTSTYSDGQTSLHRRGAQDSQAQAPLEHQCAVSKSSGCVSFATVPNPLRTRVIAAFALLSITGFEVQLRLV
eukprot:3690458-Amphidinium_carterae.1